MPEVFIQFLFPLKKMAKLPNEITNFVQYDCVKLHKVWAHFKDFLRKCPQYRLPGWMQVQTLYIRLTPATKILGNAAAGRALKNRTKEAPYNTLEEMALNNDHDGA